MGVFDFLGAALGVGGGIAGNIMNRNAIKQQNEANKQLAKYQFDLNMQAWHEQNRYNSPSAQVARLQAAGLNPQLAYGSGSNAGNASSAPTYQAPHMEAYQGNAKDMQAIMSLMPLYQLHQMAAQTKLIEKQTEKEEALTWETDTRAEANMYDNKLKRERGFRAEQFVELEYLMQHSGVVLRDQQISKLKMDIKAVDLDNAIKRIQQVYQGDIYQAQLNEMRKKAENLGASTDHFYALVNQIRTLTPAQKSKLFAEIDNLQQTNSINLPIEQMADQLGISPKMASFLKIIVSIFK